GRHLLGVHDARQDLGQGSLEAGRRAGRGAGGQGVRGRGAGGQGVGGQGAGGQGVSEFSGHASPRAWASASGREATVSPSGPSASSPSRPSTQLARQL